MRFGEELQRAMAMSDPEWAPCWLNYEMLKRLVEGLDKRAPSPVMVSSYETSPSSCCETLFLIKESSTTDSISGHSPRKDHGCACILDYNNSRNDQRQLYERDSTLKKPLSPSKNNLSAQLQTRSMLSRRPGEIVFFKLMHIEVNKASRFFENAKHDLMVREARIAVNQKQFADKGLRDRNIVNHQDILLHRNRVLCLRQDLLRIETYAILTFCGLSKILKKHDKVTGFQTQTSFMNKVVQPANFVTYPWLLTMIDRCERWLSECCSLLGEGGSNTKGSNTVRADEARAFLEATQHIKEMAQHSSSSSEEDSSRAGSKSDEDQNDDDNNEIEVERLPPKKRRLCQ